MVMTVRLPLRMSTTCDALLTSLASAPDTKKPQNAAALSGQPSTRSGPRTRRRRCSRRRMHPPRPDPGRTVHIDGRAPRLVLWRGRPPAAVHYHIMSRWSFAIDVGGTFTDCVARPPEGGERTCKLLSTGIWKGACGAGSTAAAIVDRARGQDPDEFWAGFALRLLDAGGRTAEVQRVARFARAHARLELERPFSAAPAPGTRYELDSGEEAPIGAIRRVLGLRLGAPLPALDVRLGTTRGTNALLERTGARTALAVTRGFGDLLAIGTQARPHLFALAIRKPPPLCERVIEIDERLAADGTVLRAPDRARVRAQLEELRAAGIASLAVCLLHACVNPAHEVLVAQLARAVGFAEVSASWERAPVEKLLARAQTTVLDAYLNPVLRAYVAGLRRALGAGSRLHIMTSAGGLCAAERLTGPDSLLSGPA